ncbi:hypothetical protein [Burkholderia ambifaria]|uniref:hypothetical protein n=1 Tax=Burkholderia ambifaria TaxID=152480 RepID=UPI00158B54CB|nr:hypothetical protein [Burkholderia ambifaria]
MKFFNKVAAGAVAVAGFSGVANAQAAAGSTAPDFTTLTSSIDMSTVSTAVLAVAAVMVGVYIAIKGAKIVLRMVRSA